ncbi:MAG: PilZ domain-containing protein, partial [bacterium]
MEDNRVFERINARFPLRFLDPVSGREGEAQTVDISANGLGMVTHESLEPHTPVEMWMSIPDQHEPLYTRGEIVWSNSLADPRQKRLGVRLEKAELMGLAR